MRLCIKNVTKNKIHNRNSKHKVISTIIICHGILALRNIDEVLKSNGLLAATRDSYEFEQNVGDKSMQNTIIAYSFQWSREKTSETLRSAGRV